MALQPQLQWLCESKLIRATHGVITNAWADHLNVMGPGEEDVARALANTTPIGGKLFTAERAHREVFERAGTERRSKTVCIDPSEVDEISDDEMSRFLYAEHKENVAMALRVCEDLGVDRITALRGMQKAEPDPGAATAYEIDFFGRWITFVNAFAANDPCATEKAWRRALAECPLAGSRIAVFNCRADRPDRSVQLARASAQWPHADHYVLIGTGTNIFARAARGAGLDTQRLILAEKLNAADLFELILDVTGQLAVVVGMGNIGDHGLDIARYFRNRSLPNKAESSERAVSIVSNRLLGTHGWMSGYRERPGISTLPKLNGNGHQPAPSKQNGNGHQNPALRLPAKGDDPRQSHGSGNGKHES